MPSSITIVNEPPSEAPAYNALEFCMEETGFLPSSKTNYKYVVTVNVSGLGSGGSGTATETFYRPAYPSTVTTNEYGVIDISRYVDNLLKENPPNPDTAQAVNGFYPGEDQFILAVSIDVESGWDVAGTFTVDPDGVGAVTSSTIYAWSGAFEHKEWIYQMNLGSPFNTWVCNITNGSSAKFLTNYPNKVVQTGQLGWTYYLTDTLADVDQMLIRTYSGADATGTALGTFIVDNVGATTTVRDRLARIASAPQSLNDIPGGQLSTGSQPIITSSVGSYTIRLRNSGGGSASETITINVENECRYETYRIHFLNQLGGYDAYNFTSYNKLSTDFFLPPTP